MREARGLESRRIGNEVLDALYTDVHDIDKSKLNPSNIPDVVGGYKVDLTKRILNLSTEFADAFELMPDAESGFLDGNPLPSDCFALVFRKNLPMRIQDLLSLKTVKSPNLQLPVTFGLTRMSLFSDEMFLVAIMPYIRGKSLRELVQAGVNFDENFVLTKLMKPVMSALNILHRNSIIHGCLSTKTIYINQFAEVVVGDFMSSYYGFNQQPFFETTERAQCSPFGKGVGTDKVDYYALGMTFFALISGKEFHDVDLRDMLREKLSRGTPEFLMASHHFSSKFCDLLRGMTNDNPPQRWGYTDLDAFMQNKSYNMSNLNDKYYMSRAIVFNGREYYSRKALAFDLAQTWEQSREFVKGDKIKKWLNATTHEEPTIELIDHVLYNTAPSKSAQKVFPADDERLIRILMAIDPDGPVRLKNIIFNPDSLGLLMLSAFNMGQTDVVQMLAGTMISGIFTMYEHAATAHGNPNYAVLAMEMNKHAELIRRAEIGFGIERCIYEMNTTLICQSHITKLDFCLNVKDILNYLNDNNIGFDEIANKKSLTSFIAAKLNSFIDFRIRDLQDIPLLFKSRSFQIANLIAIAQKQSRVGALENLTYTLKDELLSVLDASMKSMTIKKVLFEKVNTASQSGIMVEVLRPINRESLIKDVEGYALALRRGAEIAFEIFGYNNRENLNSQVRTRSLLLAVRFSYIICSFLLILIILKHM